MLGSTPLQMPSGEHRDFSMNTSVAPRWGALATKLWRHAGSSDINGLAAELAFRSFLAFIPFFVVVVSLGGLVGASARLENPAEQAFDLLAESLSPEVAGAIRSELERVLQSRPGGLLSA